MTTQDDDQLLCVAGRQHAYAITQWEQTGADAYTFWAVELMCPTCGATVNRSGDTGNWSWNWPDQG